MKSCREVYKAEKTKSHAQMLGIIWFICEVNDYDKKRLNSTPLKFSGRSGQKKNEEHT